jgi:hypothetical protein
MRIKWKCFWKELGYLIITLITAFIVIASIIYVTSLYLNSITYENISVDGFNQTLYRSNNITTGTVSCFNPFPFILIFCGLIIFSWSVYKIFEPCIIWGDKDERD